MNLNCWKSVGFSEALPNGLLAAEEEKDEESPEKVDATGKPEEDLSESIAIPLYVKLLWCPVFEESMNSFSNPEDSKQKEYLRVDHLPKKRCQEEKIDFTHKLLSCLPSFDGEHVEHILSE